MDLEKIPCGLIDGDESTSSDNAATSPIITDRNHQMEATVTLDPTENENMDGNTPQKSLKSNEDVDIQFLEVRKEISNTLIDELNQDLEKMKPLLSEMAVIPPDEELYAYLEAHWKEPNRIKIVVDELCGVNDTSPPLSRELSLVGPLEENKQRGKGGKGKKSTMFEGITSVTRDVDYLGKRPHSSEMEGVPNKVLKLDLADHFIESTHTIDNSSRGSPPPTSVSSTRPQSESVHHEVGECATPDKFRGKTAAEIAAMGYEDQLEYVLHMSMEESKTLSEEERQIRDTLELSLREEPVRLEDLDEGFLFPKEKDGKAAEASISGEIYNHDVGDKIEAAKTVAEEERQLQEALKMNLLPINSEYVDTMLDDEQMQEIPHFIFPHLSIGLSSTSSGSSIKVEAGASGSLIKAAPDPSSSTFSPRPSSQTEQPVRISLGPSTLALAANVHVPPQEPDPEEADPEVKWQREKEAYLLDIFPDFSPEWISNQIETFRMTRGTDDVRFDEKISQIMEMRSSDIPTRRDWEKKIKKQEELNKWSGNMTVNDMLELYGGDPAKHFKSERKNLVNKELYRLHSRVGLLDAFRFASASTIGREFRKANFIFSVAYKAIKKLPSSRTTKRGASELKYPGEPCIEFIKEKKFVELEGAINEEIEKRKTDRRNAIEVARSNNALVECECCYNECLEEDMVPCQGGHFYCKECIKRSTDVAMGDGKTSIMCLGHCKEEISTRDLQRALPPNLLSKLLSKRQAEEVGAAEIEHLVTCPFCPYSTIMENQEDKVVVCRNQDCGRDSCRLCKQPNHVPLRCEEVENEEQIRKRVEEALSEAIIRKCANPNCPASFMKTEGCNKMVCQKCGTVQCYLCKIAVPGYEHFYGQGGEPTQTRVCPLWSDNADEFHAAEVSKAAQKEAAELEKEGVKIDDLKHNPLEGIQILGPNGNPGVKK